MLRRLASDVARLAVGRIAQNGLTSCTQDARFAVAAYSIHQSTLAFSSDLKVSFLLKLCLGPRLCIATVDTEQCLRHINAKF